MFITTLFTIAKTWKQPKCPLIDEWIKKIVIHTYTHTMEYYLAIIQKKLLPFVTPWMKLEGTVLSEISQTEKDKHHMISLICGI